MSCCANKPVSLNHMNLGLTHLADDVPILNEDAIIPIVFTEIKKTIITGKSTRLTRDIITKQIDEGTVGI